MEDNAEAARGYNTPHTRAAARASSGIEMLTLSEFGETFALWGTGA